jgi:hypothetical protein
MGEKKSPFIKALVLSFFPIPKKFPIPIHIWELLGILGKYWEAYKI